jgi:hypothetical protein
MLASTCMAIGDCSNYPGMLSGLVVGVVVLAAITLFFREALSVMDYNDWQSESNYAQALLLLNWFDKSDEKRRRFLRYYDQHSGFELDAGIIHALNDEHDCMTEVLDGGG